MNMVIISLRGLCGSKKIIALPFDSGYAQSQLQYIVCEVKVSSELSNCVVQEVVYLTLFR